MKKALLMIVALLSCILAGAQNVQVSKGKELKVVAETEVYDDNTMSFLYTELVVANNRAASTYVQLFREQKFWEAPLYIHAEFRTFLAEGFTTNNVYLLGGAWGAIAKDNGFLTLEALYRYDDTHNWQFTVVSGYNKGRFTFSNYADFYGIDRLYMFSENKFFYRLAKNLQVGANIELGINTREGEPLSCYPFAVLRIDL